ncbi:MAG: glycosyltransferase family 2 protein [Clostridium sp.]|uniref:glycosyltransferase family 2 protein n=1 Tax=Clostridium sp. DSM 8431 TaxID=1761781 RepID=UPI0008E3EDA1|nr:glycosyltransferase family 2 protein [Clostridium sp. DSM 8431]MCR4944014.1 glycosyltransferase family 2 protein [Clostridium sp.]SFU60241.1 Glycosyltransferase involved in cell wall bisynthesis [Clostridium sp. DSM 8431]
MNKEKISIVIPVYNTEKYIKECIESILKIKNADIEIIAVNDGSTDNSFKILCEFANKDKRVIAINKKNSGVSDTRNLGIEKASGKWIAFVDSDDIIDSKAFDELILKADENKDMIFFTFSYMSEDGKPKEKVDYINKSWDSAEGFIQNFEILDFQIQNVWCKLYKSEIIKNNNIKFDIKISVAEDGAFNMDYYRNINSIQCLNFSAYLYRLRPGSLIHSVSLPSKGEESYKHYCDFIKYMCTSFKVNIEDYKTLSSFFINMGAINKIAAVSIDKNRSNEEIKEVLNNEYLQRAINGTKPVGIYKKIVYGLIKRKALHRLKLLFNIKFSLLSNKKIYNFVKNITG